MSTTEPRPGVARLMISVASLDRAIALYRDVLGLRLERQVGEFAWLSTTDGIEVMLHERSTTPSAAAVSIGFVVDGLDEVIASWASGGGHVIDSPALQPWGERMTVVTDADGHVVCISERSS